MIAGVTPTVNLWGLDQSYLGLRHATSGNFIAKGSELIKQVLLTK